MTVITLLSFPYSCFTWNNWWGFAKRAIRARNGPTNWKNMMSQINTHSTEDWEGFVLHVYYLCSSCCHYKWNLGPLGKCCHPQLILPFEVQKSRISENSLQCPHQDLKKTFFRYCRASGTSSVPGTPFLHLQISHLLQTLTMVGSSMSHD